MRTAAEFCSYYQIQLKPTAQSLLDDQVSIRHYFDRLREQGCLREARRVLAHALPRRRAMWWGCLCAWHVSRPEASEAVVSAIRTVAAYCADPSDVNRREAESVGRSIRGDGLAHCLARSVFFSGGSISLPNLPFVPPRPHVTGRLVSVVVYLASVRRQPQLYRENLGRYLDLGLELTQGPEPWVTTSIEQPTGKKCDANESAQPSGLAVGLAELTGAHP